MKNAKLLRPYKLGNMELKNRIVRSPMMRSRAIGNIPNQLIAGYYKQLAGAGLIITKGTSPSVNDFGYRYIIHNRPGMPMNATVKLTTGVIK